MRTLKLNPHLKKDDAQQNWLLEAERQHAQEPNPCVHDFGAKPGRYCKECRLLMRVVMRSGKVFFKCALRGDSRGPATDHRANWNACARFVSRPQRERTTAGHKVIHF